MRALVLIAIVAATAHAEPKVATRKDDAELAKRPATDPNGFTGDVIIPPKDFADASPWPRGMVIAPPDVKDRIPNLLLRPWRWAQRGLWQRFEDAVGGVIDAVTSPQL